MYKTSNEDYIEATDAFGSVAFLLARRLICILDRALLALIGRLVAEEVGKT